MAVNYGCNKKESVKDCPEASVANLVTIVSYARKIFITLSTKVYSCNFKLLNRLKMWSCIPNTSFSPLCKNGPNKPGLKSPNGSQYC